MPQPSEPSPPAAGWFLDRVTGSAAETEAIGRAIGAELGAGEGAGTVWLLTGNLGAGKTVFVRGICRGLGVGGRVRSPGFTLITRYPGPIPVMHVDLYRLERPSEVEALGWEELLLPEGILLVEWGERAREIAGPDRVEIELEDLGQDRRRIRMRALGRARALVPMLERAAGGVRC